MVSIVPLSEMSTVVTNTTASTAQPAGIAC
jgi:hypothetical protein